jgi:hypothetical protein
MSLYNISQALFSLALYLSTTVIVFGRAE